MNNYWKLGPLIYTNQYEKKRMQVCHGPAVEFTKEFLDELQITIGDRVLDVACGAGEAARDLLMNYFRRVYLFDRCSVAVTAVKLLQTKYKKIVDVQLATMGDY